MVALALLVLLAACSNDSSDPEDRKFANDPTDEQNQPTTTMTPTPPTVSTSSNATPTASPASVLKSRGAPDTIYSLSDNAITSLSLKDGQTSIDSWDAGEGQAFIAIDDAPDGSRVAAIVESADGDANLVIFDSAGAVTLSITGILDLSALTATPVSDGTGGATPQEIHVFVSWAPLGDQILVGASDGQLKTVATSGGEPESFEADTSLVGLESARWAPDGLSIGALVRNASGIGQVFRLTNNGTALTSSIVVGAENLPRSNSVEQFSWSADGSSLFYVVAERDGDEPIGGQLFELDLVENTPLLIATSGRGGPSGTIGSFVLSPDGRSVAITIAVRDGGALTFHSLVVKSLRDGSTFDIPVNGLSDVPGTWWISQGLVWNRAASEGEVFTLDKPDGSEVELQPGVVNGTPAPEATPAAIG